MKTPFNKLFWFTDPTKLDLTKDKHLVIHHTLAYGSLKDIKKLFQFYPKATVRKVFLQPKKGLYDPRTLAVVKLILGVKRLNDNAYVKKIT